MSSPPAASRKTKHDQNLSMSGKTYEQLIAQVRCLQDEGRLPIEPTREQYVSWAFGQTAIENPKVTREHAEAAVCEFLASRR